MNLQNEKLVSIIIPAYNIEDYLPQCLDSLLNQTYSKLEIIVVDDGSKDSTGTIADTYAQKDHRIKVLHQQNSGCPAARNSGLGLASGNFVAFIDGDDWIDTNWVESQLEAIVQNNADVAVCSHDEVYKNACVRYNAKPSRKFLTDREDKKNLTLGVDDWTLSAYVSGLVWKLLIRKECLKDKKDNEPILFIHSRHYADDTLYAMQILLNCNGVAINEKTMYHYRIRETSLTGDVKYIFKMINTMLLMHERQWIQRKSKKFKIYKQ